MPSNDQTTVPKRNRSERATRTGQRGPDRGTARSAPRPARPLPPPGTPLSGAAPTAAYPATGPRPRRPRGAVLEEATIMFSNFDFCFDKQLVSRLLWSHSALCNCMLSGLRNHARWAAIPMPPCRKSSRAVSRRSQAIERTGRYAARTWTRWPPRPCARSRDACWRRSREQSRTRVRRAPASATRAVQARGRPPHAQRPPADRASRRRH